MGFSQCSTGAIYKCKHKRRPMPHTRRTHDNKVREDNYRKEN